MLSVHSIPPPVEKKERVIKPKKAKEIQEDEEDGEPAGKRRRLMPETINEMKIKINDGVSPKEIAEEFGVSTQTIYALKSRLKKVL